MRWLITLPLTGVQLAARILAATITVVDSFRIVGSSDATKTLRFECDAQSANADLVIDTGAQTADRTLSIPALTANATLAVLSETQTFTGAKTFSADLSLGVGTGARYFIVNGGDSASGDGAALLFRNDGANIFQLGNKSAILGGAYDATCYLQPTGTMEFAGALNITDTTISALTVGGTISAPASSTARASIKLPHGSAPSSPVDGDMWTTTAGLFVRINGATVGPLS